jgi:hypothetical protein
MIVALIVVAILLAFAVSMMGEERHAHEHRRRIEAERCRIALAASPAREQYRSHNGRILYGEHGFPVAVKDEWTHGPMFVPFPRDPAKTPPP